MPKKGSTKPAQKKRFHNAWCQTRTNRASCQCLQPHEVDILRVELDNDCYPRLATRVTRVVAADECLVLNGRDLRHKLEIFDLNKRNRALY